MNKGKALLAVMAALVAGAAIGALFAPDRSQRIKLAMLKRKAELADLLSKEVEARFDILMAEINERKKSKAAKHNGEYSTSEMPA